MSTPIADPPSGGRLDHYRILFQQAVVGLARVGPDGRWLEVNDCLADMLGYSAEELRQRTFADVTHPDDRGRDLEAARELREGRRDRYVTEKRYIRKDGKVIWVHLTTAFVSGTADDSGFFVSAIEDITPRREAEAAHRATEARYRALVDASARIVWVTNAAGEFTDPQPEWEAFTGQSFDEYRGWGWLEAIHPADQGRTGATWQRAVASQSLCQLEYRVRRHDGEYRWFEVRAAPVISDGAIREWVGAEFDIDDRVKRRVRDELLVEAARVLGDTTDPEAALEKIAALCIGAEDQPGVADGCLVTLHRETGEYDHVAIASVDPRKGLIVSQMTRRYPPLPDMPHGFGAVIRTGRSELVPPDAFDDDVLPAIANDDEHLSMMRQLQLYSGLCVPLSARGRTFGAITLVLYGPDRRAPFSVSDLEGAEQLARSVALHLDNARLLQDAISTNEQLQQQAVELEAQATELQATASELEEHSERLEAAERDARNAREALARTFEQAPVAIAVVEGLEHRFTLANSRYAEVVQRPVMGKPVRAAFPEVEGLGYFEMLDGVFQTGRPVSARERLVPLRNASGGLEDRYFDFVYQPLRNSSGRVYGIAIVANESTEQVKARQATVESERMLRTLADAIPTLAWTAQADGYIDWYNARWYEYTGTTPQQMEGWGWQSVHDPAVLPQVLTRWRDSIATGKPFEMTFPLLGADGRFRQFLTRVVPVKDADGRVQRWFGTNTDVDAERAARVAAEEANQAKMNFLATMSHELRTPLNAISGYADLLALGVLGPLTAEQRDAIGRVQRSERHLLGLINDVLNFAKLDAGHVEYRIEDVALDKVIDSLEPFVNPQLREKGLRFSRQTCDGVRVRADEEKLLQILINLLSNAIKFTPSGGAVTIRCEAEKDQAVIVVEDTGIGIAEDRLETIFAPFVQLDRRFNTENEGTGLGLAISRDLARAMQGDITVRSTAGSGSAFRVVLPLAGARARAARESESGGPPSRPAGDGERAPG